MPPSDPILGFLKYMLIRGRSKNYLPQEIITRCLGAINEERILNIYGSPKPSAADSAEHYRSVYKARGEWNERRQQGAAVVYVQGYPELFAGFDSVKPAFIATLSVLTERESFQVFHDRDRNLLVGILYFPWYESENYEAIRALHLKQEQ